MILFDLKCQDGHKFEAWFRDGATYDAQAATGDIACPVCGDNRVAKAPMAPRISKGFLGDRPVSAQMSPEGGSAGGSAGSSEGSSAGGSDAGSVEARSPMVAGELQAQLEGLRRRIEENCDPVGDKFAEEARRIHYGETPHRDIYGQATDAEAAELVEEGVEFARVPWPVRTDS